MKISTKNLSPAPINALKPANTLIARYLVETSSSSGLGRTHKSFFQFAGSMLNGLDNLVHRRSNRFLD